MSSEKINHIDDVYMALVKGSLGINTNRDLAARMGVSEQSLSNMKSRGTVTQRIIDFAEKEGLDLPVVQFNGNALNISGGGSAAFTDGFIMVPICSAKGDSHEATHLTDEAVSDEIAFGKEWMRSELRAAPENVALLTTIGDSMEPTFRAGDQLLVDRSIHKILDEAIYALMAGGVVLIKRVRWRPDGGYTLVSDNPTYDPMVISADEKNNIEVLGRVVWWSRRA